MNEDFDRELTELLKLWRWRAADWPSGDFAQAANDIEALRARHAKRPAWTGQMAGFTPAETDRSSTGTFDQGGPSESSPKP